MAMVVMVRRRGMVKVIMVMMIDGSGHHSLLSTSILDAIPSISIYYLSSSSQQLCEAGSVTLILERKKLAQKPLL